MKTTQRFIKCTLLLAFILISSLPLTAQEELTKTYDAKGVTFDYPDDWEVDEKELVIGVFDENAMGVTIIPPVSLQLMVPNLEGDLSENIQTVFEAINRDPNLVFDANAVSPLSLNGREMVRYDFIDADKLFTMLVIRLSDGSVGALLIVPGSGELQADDEATLLAVAATLDVKNVSTIGNVNRGDTPMFTFPSGVGFDYPETWSLIEETIEDDHVLLNGPQNTDIIVLDLKPTVDDMVENLEATLIETAERWADSYGFDFDIDNYETLDFDGHEAIVYIFKSPTDNTTTSGIFVIVTYSDGDKGIIMATADYQPSESFEADVLSVTESLDVYGETESADTLGITEPIIPAEGETFTFPSGVTFNYPDGWLLDPIEDSEYAIVLIRSGANFDATFVFVDIKALSGGRNMSIETVMDQFGKHFLDDVGSDFDINNYVTLDFDGREAGVYIVEEASGDTATTRLLIITNYTDGGQGLVIGFVTGSPAENAEFKAEILSIAASFDSK